MAIFPLLGYADHSHHYQPTQHSMDEYAAADDPYYPPAYETEASWSEDTPPIPHHSPFGIDIGVMFDLQLGSNSLNQDDFNIPEGLLTFLA